MINKKTEKKNCESSITSGKALSKNSKCQGNETLYDVQDPRYNDNICPQRFCC